MDGETSNVLHLVWWIRCEFTRRGHRDNLREKKSAGHEYYINADKFEITTGANTAGSNNNNNNNNNSNNNSTQNNAPTIINNNSSSIQYTGSWSAQSNARAYQGDFHCAKNKNDSYTINFTGTRLQAYGLKDRWCGKVAVYVDGVYKKTVDCYKAIQSGNQLLYDTGVLPSGNHTVKLVILRQKNLLSWGYYHYADEFRIYK